jgi:hypothetical protein
MGKICIFVYLSFPITFLILSFNRGVANFDHLLLAFLFYLLLLRVIFKLLPSSLVLLPVWMNSLIYQIFFPSTWLVPTLEYPLCSILQII